MAIQKVSGSIIQGDTITEANIADNTVESEHLNNNVISGQTEITSGLADADELLYSDGGTVKKVGLDTLQTHILTGNLTGSAVTLDSSGDVILDADGGDVFFKDGGTTFGSATNTSGNLIIKSGTTTAATFSGANVTLAGTVGSGAITSTGVITGTGFTIGSAVITEAELEILDGASVTTTELNLLDGSAKSTSSITIADTDAFIVIDGTTTKQIPASDISTYAGGGGGATYNMIINGDFSIWQRGITISSVAVGGTSTTTNADDSYVSDRWYVLSDTDDVVDVTRATDAPDGGSKYSIGLQVETINKKFGIAQIVERINCHEAVGGTVSLSFKMKCSAVDKLDDVRAAVVSWSGTGDSVTSDIVSAWEAEGTNPTLIANATYENTPADLSPTTSWATYTIENISIDTGSTSNLIVFIWSGVTDTTVDQYLYITDVQLETSATANTFARQDMSTTAHACERYYETSMSWGEDSQYAGQRVVFGNANAVYGAACANVSGVQYRTRKRTTPTSTIYHQDGTAGGVYLIYNGTKITSVVAQHTMDYGWLFSYVSGSSAFFMGFAYYYGYTAEAEL